MLRKVKKIGILTLNGYYNYGNRLQNYALEETLKCLGFEVETILVDRSIPTEYIRLPKIHSVKELFEKIRNRINYYLSVPIMKERENKFIKFSKDYLSETDYILSNNNIPDDISLRYDFFVVGSDQVWNPYNLHGTTFFFISFAPCFKRIAYAASFGISRLPDEYKSSYSKWLVQMPHISVREEAGALIIKEQTGRNVPVLVDPTLLLTTDKWLKISTKSSNKPKGEYLLTYFLGEVSEEVEKQIKNLAKENNLNIIKLGDIKEKETYKTGPSEFIDYIYNSSIICTDSFHGTVFSILFKKPFIVFERAGDLPMYSRINTLLDKFQLVSRRAENIKLNEDIFCIDFSHIQPILEAERNTALDFLKNALMIKEEV